MIYNSFNIANFKGINHVSIDLANNRIITLVGLNESGKTSIMEGIHLFYQMIKGNDPNAEKLKEIRPKGISFTGEITIKAKLELEKEDRDKINNFWKLTLGKRTELDFSNEFSYDYRFIYELHSYKKTKREVTFEIKTTSSSKKLIESDRPAWQKVVNFIKKEIVPEILYFEDFIFEIPKEIIFPVNESEEAQENKEENNEIWKKVIDDILKTVHEEMNFQDFVVKEWISDDDAASNRLSQMERSLDTKITRRWGELFGENKVNFKEIKLVPKISKNEFKITFKIKTEDNQEFFVQERSKGFKWFFSFLLFTEFRKKRTKNILFLLDEPASNLHSSAQAKILEALKELSADSLVIYSTHSHHLINPNWLSGAFICINESLLPEVLSGEMNTDKSSNITAEGYFNYVGQGLGSDNVSYFQPILDCLDYQPSQVEPIPNIIILEGKNDWYTLKYFEKVILKKKRKSNFYPGGGRDKLSSIIRLYLSWGQPFIVLLDGDDGVKSQTNYKKEFGPYVEDRIFTLKDVFGKPWVMEDLMGVMDQRGIYDSKYGQGSYDICKANEPKKLKGNLNYALHYLLLQNKEVKINKTTVENFTKLLDFHNKALKVIK